MSDIVSKSNELRAFVEDSMIEIFSKILRVNINTGEFEVFKNDGLLGDRVLETMPDIYTYIETLISEKIIYPEYATACRRLTNPEYVRKSVFSGERRIVQSYRRRTSVGDRWITLTIIAGDDCSPENPLVLYTWREADSDAITLLDALPTISTLYDKLIRLNLSNNTYEPVIVDADEQDRLVGGVINMAEWWDGYSKNGNIAKEDMASFNALTKAGSLQKRFAEDPTPVNFRYRRKVGDELRWMQLQIAPSVEYTEENQIMLLSLKDVHEEYTAEIRSRQELIDTMSRDALTHLYNRLKFTEDLGNLSKGSGAIFTCLYVDVNGLHELNNLLGHQKGDNMLCCIADTLCRHFPEERVYRIGGDEFVVTSISLTKETMEARVAAVRQDLLKDNYEISVGIETGECGERVEAIVQAAEQAMRNDKAAYYMRNGDRRKKRQLNEEVEKMLIEKHDSERFLNVIAHQFSSVFFVDLVHDTLRYIYIPEYYRALLKETNNRFNASMHLYVERHIKPEYHELFADVLDYHKLAEKLQETGAIQFSYRKTDDVSMNLRVLLVADDKDRQQEAKTETIWIFAEDNT